MNSKFVAILGVPINATLSVSRSDLGNVIFAQLRSSDSVAKPIVMVRPRNNLKPGRASAIALCAKVRQPSHFAMQDGPTP